MSARLLEQTGILGSFVRQQRRDADGASAADLGREVARGRLGEGCGSVGCYYGCGWDAETLELGERRGGLGRRLAATKQAVGAYLTLEGQLGRGVAASLVMADQAQDLAEARRRQQAAVLRVRDLPYFAQHGGLELGALEELDGNLACDDAELLGVGLLEEVLEGALLLGREVQAALWRPR